jgi:transcription elongation factor Elf1
MYIPCPHCGKTSGVANAKQARLGIRKCDSCGVRLRVTAVDTGTEYVFVDVKAEPSWWQRLLKRVKA